MTSPSSPQALQTIVESQLQTYARFGVDLGLDRIENLLAVMDNPHQRVPIIHVAGTNGKGSVCAYLAAILTAAGYRTGRYTSPHLVHWTERICIDHEPISWGDLQTSLQTVEKAIGANRKAQMPVPTQFEVFTAAAWQYFADQQVEVAVVEVGLGGRLDATNVCQKPLATVIVSISRDHWQRLGNTLADIATEKAGILKPGVAAIAGPLPSEAAAVVTAKAAELKAPLTWVTPAHAVTDAVTHAVTDAVTDQLADDAINQTWPTPTLIYDGIQYPQTLLGDHQRVNSACAIATIQTLRAQGWQISDNAIARGMAQVNWPGRLQNSQWQGHDLLIDGAHNTDAATKLRAYLDRTFPNQAMTWLMGMLETKDHQGVFKALLRAGDRLHLVPVPGHLSAEPAVLSAIAQEACPTLTPPTIHPNLATGLAAATAEQPSSAQLSPAQPKPVPTVLCGSLYLIGTFYEHYAPQQQR